MSAEEDEHSKPEVSSGGTVATLPNYTAIPEPTLPLGELGKKSYDDKCSELMALGLLNTITREYVETFALSIDDFEFARSKGRSTRAAFEARRNALNKLEKLNGAKTIQGPGRGENPFARYGFAKRARQRQKGSN